MDLYAKGMTGEVRFDGQFVTIERNSMRARSAVGKGSKRIPVGAITSVQWKEPSRLTNGYIQFSLAGASEPGKIYSRTQAAMTDENSVVVTHKQGEAMAAIKDAVEAAIAAGSAPAPMGPAAQLQQLAQLRDAGVVTPEEFEAKKADLLGRM